MNAEMVLWLGAAAVFGAAVMAVALILGPRLRKQAPVVETPTAEHDPLVEHFNQAMDDLLPLFLADYPGMPLGDDEQARIEQIEWALKYGDPDFVALFERPDQT